MIKYPHTPYLPFSPSIENIDSETSDKLIIDVNWLADKNLAITEKMDGENTTMYTDHIHARSLDSRHHESRSWVKALHSSIKHLIPKGWRICGENLYAMHSIKYEELPSYFMVFSIWNQSNHCIGWEETKEICKRLGLETVPEINPFTADKIDLVNPSIDLTKLEGKEGFVIRNADTFHFDYFTMNLAKWVRMNHIQTDEHWMSKPVEKNLLKEKSDE